MRHATKLITVLFIFASFLSPSLAQSIDGSSKESFARSAKAIADSLTDEEKELYSNGFLFLLKESHPLAREAKGFELITIMTEAVENAHIYMDGVTKEQILVAGKANKSSQ